MKTTIKCLALLFTIVIFNMTFTNKVLALDESESRFFQIEDDANGVRVKALRDMPLSAWNSACRFGLTSNLRNEVRRELSNLIDYQIPSNYSFAQSNIQNYDSIKKGDWLFCSGDVVEVDRDQNIAGLAIRFAWHEAIRSNEQVLRKLAKTGLDNSTTRNDAVVVIAVNSQPESGLAYIERNLNYNNIILEISREHLAVFLYENQRHEDVLKAVSGCSSIKCSRLFNMSSELLYAKDLHDAMSLDNYFN